MMVIMYAWVQVLMTIFTGCAGILHSVTLGANTRKALGLAKTSAEREA